MTLKDPVIKGLCDFMGENSSWYFITLPGLQIMAIVRVEI